MLIVACSCIVSSTLFAQLPAGSIAMYPLDNSATDVGGNGYNGTLNSTAGATNRFAAANGATAFTAGTSSGTLPLALVTAMADDFSIGFWFNTTMTAPAGANWYSGTAMVDAEVCGGTSDWGTALIDGGKVCMGIGNPDITIKSTTATYNDGNWHFVTATRNEAAGTIILYIDGAQVATTSGTATTPRAAPPFIGLGSNHCAPGGVYTGILDDAIAYNRVLAAAEVSNLFNFYSAIALPLHWGSFTGQVIDGQVDLQWDIENSIHNDHFDIERSSDGSTYSVIGTLSDNHLSGPAIGGAWYHFIDKTPSKGKDYYRIRQVDIDGKYSWSPTIGLLLQNIFPTVYLQGNPVGDKLTLVNNSQEMIQRIQVLDGSGRKLIDQDLLSSNALISTDVHSLQPGFYFLCVFAGGKNKIISFLKH